MGKIACYPQAADVLPAGGTVYRVAEDGQLSLLAGSHHLADEHHRVFGPPRERQGAFVREQFGPCRDASPAESYGMDVGER